MQIQRWAALIFAAVTLGVMAFQIALALGAPWGAYAMGGAFPGQYPPPMRVAAVVQAGILGLMACVVLARAGIALPGWARVSRWAIWIIVALLGVGVVLNLITPSAGERMIWAPVAALMFVCSLLVATGRPVSGRG
jgi:hypothetical protein